MEIRPGYLRFQVDGLGVTEYVMSCFFLGDPSTPPDVRDAATYVPSLLQPFQLLDRLRFTLDRVASVTAPYGTLTVEDKTP
jgi:hypothetical protein